MGTEKISLNAFGPSILKGLRSPLLHICFLSVLSFFWCVRHILLALVAVFFFDRSLSRESPSIQTYEAVELARFVQKHFLSYSIYLPVAEIDIALSEETAFDKRVYDVQKICRHGNINIWLPLKIDMLFLGDKVVEFCLARRIL